MQTDLPDIKLYVPHMPTICRAAAKRYRQDFTDMKNQIRYYRLMRTAAFRKEDYAAIRSYNANISHVYEQIRSLLADYKFMWKHAVGA